MVGVEPEHFAKLGDGLLIVPLQVEGLAAVVVGPESRRAPGPAGSPPVKSAMARSILAPFGTSGAAAVQGRGVVGVQAEGFAEVGDGRASRAVLLQDQTSVQVVAGAAGSSRMAWPRSARA